MPVCAQGTLPTVGTHAYTYEQNECMHVYICMFVCIISVRGFVCGGNLPFLVPHGKHTCEATKFLVSQLAPAQSPVQRLKTA